VPGREYLRIIYGPEYTLPENLERLRQRGLSAKRSLALREFALGVESLERFVRGEPLRRCTSACSGYSRSRASQWIPGCEAGSRRHGERALIALPAIAGARFRSYVCRQLVCCHRPKNQPSYRLELCHAALDKNSIHCRASVPHRGMCAPRL